MTRKQSQSAGEDSIRSTSEKPAAEQAVKLEIPFELSKLTHGFHVDVRLRRGDAQILHGIRAAMERRGERLDGTGRLVNSNADVVRRIIELISDEVRSNTSLSN